MNDEDLRELRRLAIESWISQTNCWVPAWTGTWHGMSAQGGRLYLPMPLILPANGGSTPALSYSNRYGDQDDAGEIDTDGIFWRVYGRDSKQPFVEMSQARWDSALDIKITGTWGIVGIDSPVPLRVKQAIVGLIRWHSLSLGVDGDDARDQSTLNRIMSEGTRDTRQEYHQSAIGMGLTGDRAVDRTIAEYRIDPPPWAVKRGSSYISGDSW